MKISSKLTKYLLIFLILITLSGCATIPYTPPTIPQSVAGIYHEVQRGETLWRISQAYDIDMKEIARLNKLPDTSRINAGQLVFIPYAKQRLDAIKAHAKEESFIWPVNGKVISFFGSLKGDVKNKGIDITARQGENIVASRSGKVSFCDERVKGFGKTIIIDHGDTYSTVYAHNSDILVKAGDYVRQGTVIARAGKTGRTEVTCLHFEIRKQHQPENPFYYLP